METRLCLSFALRSYTRTRDPFFSDGTSGETIRGHPPNRTSQLSGREFFKWLDTENVREVNESLETDQCKSAFH